MSERPDVRLVAMDFDWTLYGHGEGNRGVPPATQRILGWLLEHEIEVGLSSGRYWWDMRNLLVGCGMAWGDPFPSFVVTRETFIYWTGVDAMEPDADWNEARGVELAELTAWLCERETEWRLRLESAGLMPTMWYLWGDYGLEVHFADIEQTERARALFAEWTVDQPLATTHRNRTLAHVVLSTATKGGCVARAAETRGLLPDQALAIGDSANDLTMLDGRCGLRSATVSNGEDEVKAAVRANHGIIAETEAGEGVAEILYNVRTLGWFR